MINILKGTVLAALLLGAFLWWQHSEEKSQKYREDRKREKIERRNSSALKKSVELPNGDGTVYILESPADNYDYEVYTCMLHVKGGASVIGCTPAARKPLTASD